MDHEIDIVDQDPLGVVVALDIVGTDPHLFQAHFDLVRDGLHLPRIRSATQHKVVGKRPFFHFQDAELFGLLFEAGLNGGGDLLLQFTLLHAIVILPVRFVDLLGRS